MFKITQNTIRQFTLAEILLMAAMNEINANQRTFERTGKPAEIHWELGNDR